MGNILKDFCKGYEVLPLNTPIRLNFKMDGLPAYFEGKEYTVTLACSNRSVSFSPNKFILQNGYTFNTTIQSTAAGHALIEISVDGVINARFSFKFVDSKDVFKKPAIDLLKDELRYINRQLGGHDEEDELSLDEAPPRRPEYLHRNYCMAGAERGLSRLLGDTKNFYFCERETDEKKNNINFSNLSAKERGQHFQRIGYTEQYHPFKGDKLYKIIESNTNLIYKAKDLSEATKKYHAVEDVIIELTPSAKKTFTEMFENDLKGKELGYHVYYFTVTDGFHTLILIIDTITSPCTPTYEIWDQHARSRSFGLLADIEKGMRRQTSWTFANSCLRRYEKKKTDKVDYTDTYLWKIRRKK